MTQAFIFDFDGTLVDSEQAIYQCFKSITKQLAPNRIEYAKNILIGPPLRDTALEILGPDHQNLLDEFVQLFISMHDEQVIQHTQPFPGVIDILNILHEKKSRIALATNKRKAPTLKLIKYFKWEKFFKFIECSDCGHKIRDKDQMIKDIFQKDKGFMNGFFVGDTLNDGISANNNHLKFIKADYGYGLKQNWKNINIYSSIDNIIKLKKMVCD